MLLLVAMAGHAADVAPPLPPTPRTLLAEPKPGTGGTAGDEAFARKLQIAIAQREGAIAELLRARAGVRPMRRLSDTPTLEAPAEERDRAWEDLHHAIGEWIGRMRSRDGDALATNRPAQVQAQQQSFSATNRVAVAECWQELAAASQGDTEVREGIKELAGLDLSTIPEHLRPRTDYLGVWFQAELARRSADRAEALDAAGRARTAADEFRKRHAGHELAGAIDALLQGLPVAAKP